MNLDRSIIESSFPSLPKDAPASVAHYTRIGSLCHFFPVSVSGWGSAWATAVQFLNDREELSLGLETLTRVAKQRKTRLQLKQILASVSRNFGRMDMDAFQMSFSGNPDELGQWRGYGSNGFGCSVQTSVESLVAVADVSGWVLYDQSAKEGFARSVLDRLEIVTDPRMIEQAFVVAGAFMKHEGFRSEREYRVVFLPEPSQIRFRETGERLVPFIDYLHGQNPLPVGRILIGPGWQLARLDSAALSQNHVVMGIQRLLSARAMTTTALAPSSIPYDPR